MIFEGSGLLTITLPSSLLFPRAFVRFVRKSDMPQHVCRYLCSNDLEARQTLSMGMPGSRVCCDLSLSLSASLLSSLFSSEKTKAIAELQGKAFRCAGDRPDTLGFLVVTYQHVSKAARHLKNREREGSGWIRNLSCQYMPTPCVEGIYYAAQPSPNATSTITTLH